MSISIFCPLWQIFNFSYYILSSRFFACSSLQFLFFDIFILFIDCFPFSKCLCVMFSGDLWAKDSSLKIFVQ